MNVNNLIAALQALVEEDAANGELPVLVDDGRSNETHEEPDGAHLANAKALPGHKWVFEVDYEYTDYNCIVIE